jgi:hypothetical protein
MTAAALVISSIPIEDQRCRNASLSGRDDDGSGFSCSFIRSKSLSTSRYRTQSLSRGEFGVTWFVCQESYSVCSPA